MLFSAIIVIILLRRARTCALFSFLLGNITRFVCACVCVCAPARGQCECALGESCQPPLCGEHSICDSDKYSVVMIYELLYLLLRRNLENSSMLNVALVI